MENYENLGTIGEGTYGVVIKARHKETGQIVAIKKFKESDDDEQVRKTSLREVRVLKQLRHDNIINLLEVFRRKGKLYLVFEYVEKTILELLEKHPYGLDDQDVKRYAYQLLRGVEYCHAHGIVHRDIKPENILISKHGALKLCDFGFARLLSGPGALYTDYVATRWYRSPELLVGDAEYGKGVDIWAIGCIFAEITNGIPLFPGESDIDQLFHIIKCFGQITPRQSLVFQNNPLYHGIELPNPVELDTLDKRFGGQINDIKWLLLLKSCLANEPRHRCTCTELLSSAYFQSHSFAEKYEEELKIVMEKDAAANLMRLRRQKQRRPRSNTKSELSQGTAPSTPQHAWAISPAQTGAIPQQEGGGQANLAYGAGSSSGQGTQNTQSSSSNAKAVPKPPRRESIDGAQQAKEQSGLPNLKIQTPRPLPVCGFPYSEPQPSYPEHNAPQESTSSKEAHIGHHQKKGSVGNMGSIPMGGFGSSLPCLSGLDQPQHQVKLKKKTKKSTKAQGQQQQQQQQHDTHNFQSTPLSQFEQQQQQQQQQQQLQQQMQQSQQQSHAHWLLSQQQHQNQHHHQQQQQQPHMQPTHINHGHLGGNTFGKPVPDIPSNTNNTSFMESSLGLDDLPAPRSHAQAPPSKLQSMWPGKEREER